MDGSTTSLSVNSASQGAATKNRFAAYSKAGFLGHAIPILPYNAVLSDRSTVSPEQRGKVPGRYNVEHAYWTGFTGWTTEAFTMDDVRKWDRWPQCNVGLRTGTILAVDGDTEHAADVFAAVVTRVLGPSPRRFRANSPRFLLPYRLKDEGYEEKPRKRMIKFASPDGKEHQFDLLAHGQQFVCEGIHTSGVPIEWEGGFDPVEMTFAGLTEITLSQWQSLGFELSTAIEANDCTIVAVSAAGSSDNRLPVFSDAHRARDMEAFAAAIRKIDNRNLPYDDWIALLHAIKTGCNADHAFFVDVVLPWCLAYSSNTEEIVESKWNSIAESTLGAEFVFSTARTDWGFNGGDDVFDSTESVPGAEPANDDTPPTFSELALARRFVDKHENDVRFIVAEKAWFIRDAGGDWMKDEANALDNMVNGFTGEESTVVSRQGDLTTAIRVATAHCQTAILKLAQSDPRVVIKRIVFAPGQTLGADELNSWRGFAVEPKSGSWKLFKQHMLKNLCDGRSGLFEYLVKWMAHGVQHPEIKPEVAVVLKGRQGTGKGVFANQYGALFGRHYFTSSSPDHLVGKHNAHMRDTLVLFADEAFFAGDRKSIGALYTLISEGWQSFEPKYINAFMGRSYLRVIMASNNEWVIPASEDSRRFFVLNVADHHMQDTTYFAAIDREMKNGGLEAMLHELLHMDLSSFDTRRLPETEGLTDQKISSLTSVGKFWHHALVTGKLGHEPMPEDGAEIGRARMYEQYLEFNKGRYDRHPDDIRVFGKRLKQMLPALRTTRPGGDGPRPVMYKFPSLAECRRSLERFLRVPALDWDGA